MKNTRSLWTNRLFFLILRGPLHEAHKYGMIRPRQKIASRNVSYTFFMSTIDSLSAWI